MGEIITFYSFKGGVGRTMALANIACGLAAKGKRVLIVDWDLEAPGLHRYFLNSSSGSWDKPKNPTGTIGLLRTMEEGGEADSTEFETSVVLFGTPHFPGTELKMLAAGLGSEHYEKNVLTFDWTSFYTHKDGSYQMEALRDHWRERFDYILIDSRTGITDTGGICTIFLPDVLALVFTANEQSFQGALETARKAEIGRQSLSFDRRGLTILPIPSRFDARTESAQADAWMSRFDTGLRPFFGNWCPKEISPRQILERIKIPHVPFFSFGEKLPIVTHSTTDPDLPGFYYKHITDLIAEDFSAEAVLSICPVAEVQAPLRVDTQRPSIYISAVSGEFRELRQLLHDSFAAHFHVISQDSLNAFPGGDVRQLINDAIDRSHAVIHLAGVGFGATAGAPFSEMPSFLCSWPQYEYYYAHSFDLDPARRKQIFAIVCGPALASPDFMESDDAILTAAHKASLQEAHCYRIHSGKFDGTPLSGFPRTVNHGRRIEDSAAILRAAIAICAQLVTAQPAFQAAGALVQVSLQERLQPLLEAQPSMESKQSRSVVLIYFALLTAIVLLGSGTFYLLQKKQERTQEQMAKLQRVDSTKLAAQLAQVSEALSRLQQQTDPSKDPLSGWSQERLETALAQQMQLKPEELRQLLTLGRTSTDALIAGQALLAAGEAGEALKQFDQVISNEKAPQRLILAYSAKAQIAYDQANFPAALSYRKKAAALVVKEKDPIAWASVQEEIATLQLELAQYEEAQPLMREIIRLNEKTRGPSAPETAKSLNNLATLLQATNRLAEAEPLMRRALAIDEATYGKSDPNVATSLNNLATLLQATNRLTEAEPLMRRALQINEASYGRDHRDVARSLNNLALLLLTTNRLTEAELLMRRALEIDEAAYGKAHPNVATSLINLAKLLKATGRFNEAEPLMRQALQIDEAAYGNDHPTVARDLNNLAWLLKDNGRLTEAEPLMRRSLAINEKALGQNHPGTAGDLLSLAWLLKDTDRVEEAEPLMRRALKIDEAAYGNDHPDVAVDLSSLAWLLKDTNRLNEAEPLSRRAVGIVLRFQARTGYRNRDSLLHLSKFIAITRALKLPDSEIHTRLVDESEKAGLEPAAFEALWAEALSENYVGPYLVTVDEAVAGGQGSALGIQPGDVILRYHGEAITTMAQLIQLTGEVKEEAIPLEIRRGKEILKLTAKPGKLGLKIQNVMPPAPAE